MSPAVLAVLLSACSMDGACHGLYGALVRQHCADRPGQPACAGDHKTYDDYRQARAQLLKLHATYDCADQPTGEHDR
ncbi:MAG: hypothetical protein LDL19_05345 [Thiobacillus sp.]|nr:hypothetical protein [Thiobacillus sp.]